MGLAKKALDPLDLMGGVFGGKKPAPPAAPPAAPTMDNASVQRAAEEAARQRANAGRASTILSQEEEQKESAKRVLLGAG